MLSDGVAAWACERRSMAVISVIAGRMFMVVADRLWRKVKVFKRDVQGEADFLGFSVFLSNFAVE